MAAHKSLKSTTKMTICGKWLHLTSKSVSRLCQPLKYLDKLSLALLAHYFELQSSVLRICWQCN